MRLGLDLKGLKEVDKEFERLLREVPEAVAVGLYLEAEAIMAKSIREVPVDTGRLRATGFVQEPVIRGTGVTVMMGYGTNYAVYVHENTTARHTVGKAKFLQHPLEAAAEGFGSRVAKRAAQALIRGTRFRPGTFPTEPKDEPMEAV